MTVRASVLIVALVAGLAAQGSCRSGRAAALPTTPPAAAAADAEAVLSEATTPLLASRLEGTIPLLTTEMTEVQLSEAAALPTLVLYFSTTCPHCWNVAGEFQESCDRLAEHGVQCMGVVSSSSRLGQVRDFAERTGMRCPLYLDYAGRFRDTFEMASTPTGVFFDERGRDTTRAAPYYRGASITVEMAIAEGQGRDPQTVWERGRYVGARACSPCHVTEYNSWLLSSHAVTTVRLPGETHLDPACTACHGTGSGEPGGFVDLATTAHLRDVGCEACHGPSGGHGPDGVVAADVAGSCARCHDAEHTLAGEIGPLMEVLDHRLADSVAEERWDLRRLQLAEGQHERLGLVVAPGECAGSAACEACHPAQVAAWAASGHAHARQTLVAEGSGRDESCLECHVPRGACDPPLKSAGGVECEICHGPGAAHVGDPTIAVAGIRAASAPFCVVEPRCRECHTESRDPEWDLEVRGVGVH